MVLRTVNGDTFLKLRNGFIEGKESTPLRGKLGYECCPVCIQVVFGNKHQGSFDFRFLFFLVAFDGKLLSQVLRHGNLSFQSKECFVFSCSYLKRFGSIVNGDLGSISDFECYGKLLFLELFF